MWYHLQFEFLPQTHYDVPQPYSEYGRCSSLSVGPSGLPEPGLLGAIPSLDPYSQQSCTVDTFLSSLCNISRKENPPSRSSITRRHSNSNILKNNLTSRARLCLLLPVGTLKTGPRACPFLDKSIRNVGERDSRKPFSPTSSGSNTIRFWSPT
ncbi:SYCP2_SLD domain-containing protein [Trichonephila clavipes]|uniref:SYCP2_SLD domain-containing protein n=1 Tax=Trichonephila clavipes TaxID=2585209 RepID=A0A8X6S9L8_TRICX|nr:SYCP2_SLD domain-containing protein [Trichonephila clavipes]